MSRTKRNVIRITVVFLLFLVICTFVSRAVYNSTLIKVTTTYVRSGIITHTAETEGTILYPDIARVRADENMKILETLCEQGDLVTAGDPLFVGDPHYYVDADSLALQIMRLEFQVWSLDEQLRTAPRSMRESLERQKELVLFELDMLIKNIPEDVTVRAPFDGLVNYVISDEESIVGAGVLLAEIIPLEGARPEAVFYLSAEDERRFFLESRVMLTFADEERRSTISANVTKKEWDRERERYVFYAEMRTDDLSLHERRVSVYIVHGDEQHDKVVPASIIFKDEMGEAVFVLTYRHGLFGTEHFVRKVNIDVVDRNDSYAAVSGISLPIGAEVIVSHSAPLFNGDVVWPAT